MKLILLNIIKQLAKAKSFTYKSTIMFGSLLIVILIEDFHKFFLIIGRLLWDKDCIEKNYYGKIL